MDILRDKIVTNRKEHRCSGCGRLFGKGIKMRTQVNTYDGIRTWRSCSTCDELLSKYRSHFEDDDRICYGNCIEAVLEKNQTAEDLLEELNKQNNEI